MLEKISSRQEKILKFINKKIKESGYPPSVREIAKAVNLSSSATVHSHLKKLEEKGYLKRNPSKPRAISLLSRKGDGTVDTGISNLVYVPIVGRIAAGKPILAEENKEIKRMRILTIYYIREVLKRALSLMGIPQPELM